MKTALLVGTLFGLLVTGVAVASHGPPWWIINSAGPALQNDNSYKRSAVRCFHMQWDTSGYDCGSYFCEQVAGPKTDSLGVRAVNCVDLNPPVRTHNRRCDLKGVHNESSYGRMYYSQSHPYADYALPGGAQWLCDYGTPQLMVQ